MKTKEITLYKFNELDEDAQDRAIEKLSDINVDHEWWDYLYEDAERAGLKITEFDLGRGNKIKGKLVSSFADSLDAILKDHGDPCNSYKTALQYRKALDDLIAKDLELPEDEQDGYEFNEEKDELAQEFLKEILEDYLQMLRADYEYWTGREAIVETITANDYDFDENGNIA